MRIQAIRRAAVSGYHVAKRDRRGFALHAAPQAIEAAIVDAQRRLRAVEEEVRWLRVLQAERATQVIRGEWPTPRPEGAP
jgi:hypothetical protein